MRLLFVIENYLPHIGGAELLFKNLCEGLAARGHEVTIITHRIPGTPKEERKGGVRIVRVPSLDNRYLFTFTAVPAAIKHARKADVVSTTTPNGAPAAWLAARLTGRPVLLTVLETWAGKWRAFTDFPAWKAGLHDFLERMVLLPRFDAYACISKATERRLREAKPGLGTRAKTIYIGFEPEHWARKRATGALRKRLGLEGKFVILGYGRPGTSKGFPFLLDAFPLIKRRIPDAVLVLILSTDPQYKAELDGMKARAHHDVLFLEPQPYNDLPAYAQMADCVVVPSLTEGFGYTTLESCATGTPVVASDTASIPEVVHGKHVLVKPRSPMAIADGVVKVFRKKWDRTPEKRFPWSKAVVAYEKEYGRLAK